MSDAACAEEEEGLRRVMARTATLTATVSRLAKGELKTTPEALEGSRDNVLKALKLLDKADALIFENIRV